MKKNTFIEDLIDFEDIPSSTSVDSAGDLIIHPEYIDEFPELSCEDEELMNVLEQQTEAWWWCTLQFQS